MSKSVITPLTKDDVWGKYDEETHKRVSDGMIITRSGEYSLHFNRVLPYKSVVVVCDKNQFGEVSYWLEYVHGGDCIIDIKELPKSKLAIQSDYQCW